MKILFSTSSLYRMRFDWLNELAKTNEVIVAYLEKDPDSHSEDWLSYARPSFSMIYCRGIDLPKLGKISFSFIRQIKKEKPDVIILDGYGFVTQWLIMAYLNRKKIPYYVNVDGIVDTGLEKGFKFRFKSKLLSSVPHYFCGSKATNGILERYGVKKERIVNHPFTSLFEKDIFPAVASAQEKEKLRSRLGITEKHVVITVGRFTYLGGYGKGYDVLIRTAEKADKDIGWYIVGGKPTREFADLVAQKNLTNVHFVEFMEKESLKDYYRASDVFVLMTVSDVWGLVVNEAMACGLPVITTDKCMAGLDLINDGEEGYIVPVGDSEALLDRLQRLFADDEFLKQCSVRALERIGEYTIENMAQIHNNCFSDSKNV